jgi:hypothetical protein
LIRVPADHLPAPDRGLEHATDRQRLNIELFERSPHYRRTIDLAGGFVRRFLPLYEMGDTWGITFCPSGRRDRLTTINAGCAVYPLIARLEKGQLLIFMPVAATPEGRSLPARLISAGFTVEHETVDETVVPYVGLHLHSWEAADFLIEAGHDPIAQYVHEATSRPLVNRLWNNPVAGALLLDELGETVPDRPVRTPPVRRTAPVTRGPATATRTPRRRESLVKYRLARPGELDLVFDGVLLAEVTSRCDADVPMWTELRLYRTASQRYVAESVSFVLGDPDRVVVRIADDVSGIVTALDRTQADGFPSLRWLGPEALERASLEA